MNERVSHPQSEPCYYGEVDLSDIEDELRGILAWSIRYHSNCHSELVAGIASVAAFEVVIKTLQRLKTALPDLDPGDPDSFFAAVGS